MSRLSYAWKFALIGLVLLIPGGLALRAYWTQQGAQIAFSAKERVGMVYLEPAQELVVALVDARSAAVAGKPVPSLDDALAAVERAEAENGAELETTKLWGELKTAIEAATRAKTGNAAGGLRRLPARRRRRARPGRPGRQRVEPDPRPGPRHLLPDGHPDHQAADGGRSGRAHEGPRARRRRDGPARRAALRAGLAEGDADRALHRAGHRLREDRPHDAAGRALPRARDADRASRRRPTSRR